MRSEKPSRTAYKVALNILALGAEPSVAKVLPAGIVDATANLLTASGVAGVWTIHRYRSPRMVNVYKAFDWMMPGQFIAFAYRKAFCEHQVRAGIASGASQILVLGAGYDTLSWRLAPEFPQVGFFEIDHPATGLIKAQGVEHLGSRDNLHLIAVDLAQSKLLEVLTTNKDWDLGASTVIVAEGLLQYLTAEAVKTLFVQCSSIAQTSRMVFTYIPCRKDGRPAAGPWTGLVLWLLRVGGEPWLWSIRAEELDRFLRSVGWDNSHDLVGSRSNYGVEFYAMATK